MQATDDRMLRLGLLLAGAGAGVRRRVGQLPPGSDLARGLEQVGVRAATLAAAVRLAETDARHVHDEIMAAGWRWLTPGDPEYPHLLTRTSDPPLGLFVRGTLARTVTVAVVGSRSPTPYGLQVARLLGEELASADVIVVSGMARGIDAAAHRGALAGGGPTWAVWGTGPDRVYPSEHRDLAEDIAARGGLLTEYPPGTPPRRHHFPERNRILAGLARVVVVVEAAARSGALVTARLALEEGREVMAVPGNIFSEVSVGPNTLLRVGARPLLTPRDLFDALGDVSPGTHSSPPAPPLLASIPAGGAASVDEIAAGAGMAVAEIAGELLRLELAGEVERLADGRYIRVRSPLPSTADSEGLR